MGKRREKKARRLFKKTIVIVKVKDSGDIIWRDGGMMIKWLNLKYFLRES